MKKIVFKIFAPGNQRRRVVTILAPQGKKYTPQGVEQLQNEMADKVERAFPGHDYRFVPIGASEFNFVHEDGCRKCQSAASIAS